MRFVETPENNPRHPGLTDEEHHQQARVFFIACSISIIALSVFLLYYGIFGHSYNIVPMAILLAVSIFAFALNNRGLTNIAAYVFVGATFAGLFSLAVVNDGLHDSALQAFPAVLIVASMMLEKRQLVLFSVLSLLSLFVLGMLQLHGVVEIHRHVAMTATDIFDLMIIYSTTIIGVMLISSYLRESGRKVKDRELRLSKSEANLRRAQKIAKLGMWEWDPVTDRTEFSDDLLDIFGLLREDAGKTFRSLLERVVHPEDRHLVEEAEERTRRTGFGQTIEYRIVLRNGNVRWIRAIGEVVQENGKITKVIGTNQDITETKHVEEMLQLSEERYKLMFESAPLAINITRGIEMTYANPSYLAMFGFSSLDDLRDLPPLELFAPQFRANILENIQRRSMGLDVPNFYETECIRRDGTKFPVLLYLTRTMFADGAATVAFTLDLTARKSAEEQLRKLSLAVEQSPASIVITDTKGNIEYVNPRYCQVTGYSPEEVVGKNPRILKSGHTPESEYKAMWETISSGKEWHGEFHNKKKNGDLFWERVSISPVKNSDNVITNYVEVKEDISEMRLIQSRLRQSEKMEAIGQLAGGIAHDFNNVLLGIVGYTEMSLPHAGKGTTLERNLLKVLNASQRAAQLVKQILTFSRQGNAQKSVIAVRPIMKEALDLIRATIPSSVIIESDLSKDSKPVLADPTKIHEMLLNIASNSVHAMGQKGTLTVQLHSTFLRERTHGRIGEIPPGEYTVIEVADTGCGMDARTLSKAFEPFYTTKAVGAGTGMGLSVVLGIVQSHGADLQAESEPGKGTTLRIFFPVAEGLVSGSAGNEPQVRLSGTESILFVDDEEMVMETSKELLTRLGYNVTCVSDSSAALTIIRERGAEIDILVTDQTMPGMTGIELAKEVLKIRKDLPIIICTGYSNEINPERAGTLGIRQIVMKPYGSHELGKALRNVLDQNALGGVA